MAIKETEVLIGYSRKTASHYKAKGYIFPTRINSQGREFVKLGTPMWVKVEDLPKGSNIKVTKICDICGNEKSNQPYGVIIKTRNNSADKLDRCAKCGGKKSIKSRGINNCLASSHPEFAKLFWDKEVTFKFSYGSGRKADFKCPKCGNKVENKTISDVFAYGLACPCKDGVSYSEKFVFNLLTQLNIKFEFQKIFDWSTKAYDFYLNELKIIIETHGKQHFENAGFEIMGGRTLEEEQKNDKIKRSLAIENGVKEYLEIDCRKSEMEFIKFNILKSQLTDLFDLSQINWLECHEFACKSIIKDVCDLWNKGYSIKKIFKIVKVSRGTITRYLKQGKVLNLCDYDSEEAHKRGGNEIGKKFKKPIIQLSKNGEFVKEWNSATDVEKAIGISQGNISTMCKGNGKKSAGGFIWIFKEDYSPQKVLDIVNLNREYKSRKPIIQMTLNGEYIREWESIKKAGEVLNFSFQGISKVCLGKQKTAGGYKWMFKEEYYQKKEALV